MGLLSSTIYASKCRNCNKNVQPDLVQFSYCADCILEGMQVGFRLKLCGSLISAAITGAIEGGKHRSVSPLSMVGGAITGVIKGGNYLFEKGTEAIDVDVLITILRKLMNSEKLEMTNEKILLLPEFFDISLSEFSAMKIKASELGHIETSPEDVTKILLTRLHIINSFEDANELSKIAPLLLITGSGQKDKGVAWFSDGGLEDFKERIFPFVSLLARRVGIITGWSNISIKSSDMVRYLDEKKLKFEGCFLIKDGGIVTCKKIKTSFFDVDKSMIRFILDFIADCFKEQ